MQLRSTTKNHFNFHSASLIICREHYVSRSNCLSTHSYLWLSQTKFPSKALTLRVCSGISFVCIENVRAPFAKCKLWFQNPFITLLLHYIPNLKLKLTLQTMPEAHTERSTLSWCYRTQPYTLHIPELQKYPMAFIIWAIMSATNLSK